MSSLKIVHTPVRAFPYMGGVEYHVHYVAEELIRKRHQVIVVAAKLKESFSIKTTYERVLLPWLFKVTNTEITFSLPFVLSWLKSDIIHSHIPTPWTSDWSMIVGALTGRKKVLTIHNDMNKNGFVAKLITKIYVNTLMRLSVQLADKIIIVNPNWQKSFTFTKHVLLPYLKKIVVIPNGVDTTLFAPKGQKKKHHILCVSILDKYHDFKGIPYLLEAFVAIKKKYPDATLQIVGEGELKKLYQDQAQTMSISEATTFSGQVDPKELAKFYSEATVFVLPSTDTEGFGLVLLESLACETPVISTNVAGVVREVAEHDCGVIVETRSSLAIREAVSEYFDNFARVKAHGERGRKMVESTYSWKQVTQLTEELYYSL